MAESSVPAKCPELQHSSSDKLVALLGDQSVENEQVCDWIDHGIGSTSETFIRALTTAICRPAWKVKSGSAPKPEDIDLALINHRMALLRKYVNHEVCNEMETLYAVQLIVHERGNPYGSLRVFFDALYDGNVVSDASFYDWRDKPEIGEQTGRDCDKLSLLQFYHWLEEDTTTDAADVPAPNLS